MVVNGNYFEQELIDVEVAYSKLLSEKERKELKQNRIRRWTVGEVVTTLIKSGLTINALYEEEGVPWAFPEGSPKNIENMIPGLFTIIANR